MERGLSATCWLLPLPGQPFRAVERREDKPGSRNGRSLETGAGGFDGRRGDERRDGTPSNKVLTASESVRVVKVRVGDEAKGNLPVRACVCARAWVEEMAGCWRGRQRETAGVVDPFGQ